MGLKGVKVSGQTYHFDHEYLENNPIPAFDPTEGNDLHCVLTVEESFLEWEPAERFLAAYAADDGDVLTVEKNGSYTELVWKSIGGGSSPLPTYDTTYPSVDEGKVLTVSDCGSLEWTDVRSGGGSNIDQYIDSWDSEDAGKVLTVTSGCALGWTNILPVGGSSGNVLTLNENLEPYWGDMVSSGGSGGGTSLPPYDEDDAGKALLVSDNGGLEWDHAIPTTECFMSDTFGIMTVTGDIENMEWVPVQRDLLGFPSIENVNRAVLVAYDHDDYGTSMGWEELDEDLLLAMLPSFGPDDNGKVLMTNGRYVFWDNPS